MRKSPSRNLARGARRIAAALLLVIFGAIVYHFVFKRSQRVETPDEPTKTESVSNVALDRQEGVEHVLFKGEKGKIKARADRYSVGEDKINHLEGRVEMVDYGEKGGRQTIITADRVDYDQDMNHFKVFGEARLREKDALLESPSFEYDKEKEVFKTDQGVVFTSTRLDGRAKILTYWQGDEKLELVGDLDFKIRPKLKTDQPISTQGNMLVYRRKARAGRIEGDVSVTHGRSRGTAGSLFFSLSKGEQQIKNLILQNKAKMTFFTESPGTQGATPESEHQIEAGKIILLGFPGEARISQIWAKDDCFLSFSASPNARDEVRAQRISLFFNRAGELKNFQASRTVQVIIGEGKAQEERRIWGDTVAFNKKSGILTSKGKETIRARIISGRSEVEAGRVILNLDTGDMKASEAVKLVLKPDQEGPPIGFFSKGKPVFITCRDLTYTKTKKLFEFKEDVRIWQDKNVIRAKTFNFVEDSGEVFAQENVKVDFSHKPKDKPEEERLTISSAEMSYVPRDKRMAFKHNCSLNAPAIFLTSEMIQVLLKEPGNEMDRILAKDHVVIVQEKKEGLGEEADYDLTTDIVVMTGNPVLIDKEKGTTEGDKLTFYLTDGRIVIENRERERSATVIKREL